MPCGWRPFGAIAASVWLVCISPAIPHDAPSQQQERIAVQAWGAAHADCAEWTDLCTVCARVPEGIACSTPGVACLPQPVVCRRSVPPPPAPKPEQAPQPATPPEAKP